MQLGVEREGPTALEASTCDSKTSSLTGGRAWASPARLLFLTKSATNCTVPYTVTVLYRTGIVNRYHTLCIELSPPTNGRPAAQL